MFCRGWWWGSKRSRRALTVYDKVARHSKQKLLLYFQTIGLQAAHLMEKHPPPPPERHRVGNPLSSKRQVSRSLLDCLWRDGWVGELSRFCAEEKQTKKNSDISEVINLILYTHRMSSQAQRHFTFSSSFRSGAWSSLHYCSKGKKWLFTPATAEEPMAGWTHVKTTVPVVPQRCSELSGSMCTNNPPFFTFQPSATHFCSLGAAR